MTLEEQALEILQSGRVIIPYEWQSNTGNKYIRDVIRSLVKKGYNIQYKTIRYNGKKTSKFFMPEFTKI